MKISKVLLSTAAVAGLAVAFNATPAQAATIQTPIHGTSYIQKGNTYKLHLKVPGRVTVTTSAKYTIKNTSPWKCIPYPTKHKNTKVFYLRAGNYTLTTTSKSAKVKTSFTKLTKIKKSLDDFPIGKNELTLDHPDEIKLNKSVKGMLDMYKTYRFAGQHYYKFTLTKPQKVTMDLSTMPVYALDKGNIFSRLNVRIDPVSLYNFKPQNWNVKGKVSHKTKSWYLPKGTYTLSLDNLRGRYQFKLKTEDTDLVPENNKITKITPTAKGLQVDYTKSDKATGYEVYIAKAKLHKPMFYNSNKVYGINSLANKYPAALSQVIPINRLVNGETYYITTRAVNTVDGENIFSTEAEPIKYTYHAITSNAETPKAPTINVSYYDDNGNDEPYIDIDWNKNDKVDSYEVAYRVKGQDKWTTFVTKENNGTEIDNSTDKDAVNYFVKGKTYEVRVRALSGSLKSDWSEIKTTTVTVTPAG